jgi:hypothetical protein
VEPARAPAPRSQVIRYPAARKVVEQLLQGSNVRLPMTEEMLDVATRMFMLAVDMDEQRQRSEKLLLAEQTKAE